MTHELAAIASAGGKVIRHWMFVCTCHEAFQHQQRRAAWAAFAVHAHTENKRDGHRPA